MLSPHCDYCGSGARDDYFKAYIRYGVTTSDTCNIQASYGHTTLGLGSINVDISASGNVSISAGAHTQLKVYTGRAVTLK